MSETIKRSPAFTSSLAMGKKNMWDGAAVIEIAGNRIPIRITEFSSGSYGECQQITCEELRTGQLMDTIKSAVNAVYGSGAYRTSPKYAGPKIVKVLYHAPATIVFWSDNTKTVVKCSEDDVYSPEVGLAMAITKKFLGNEGNYNNELRKWLPSTYFATDEVPT